MIGERGQDGVGDRPDARLDRRPVGDPLGDEGGDAIVELRRAAEAATSTSGRSTSTQPSTWLTWIWLRPNVRGCWALASRKKRARPMNEAA